VLLLSYCFLACLLFWPSAGFALRLCTPVLYRLRTLPYPTTVVPYHNSPEEALRQSRGDVVFSLSTNQIYLPTRNSPVVRSQEINKIDDGAFSLSTYRYTGTVPVRTVPQKSSMGVVQYHTVRTGTYYQYVPIFNLALNSQPIARRCSSMIVYIRSYVCIALFVLLCAAGEEALVGIICARKKAGIGKQLRLSACARSEWLPYQYLRMCVSSAIRQSVVDNSLTPSGTITMLLRSSKEHQVFFTTYLLRRFCHVEVRLCGNLSSVTFSANWFSDEGLTASLNVNRHSFRCISLSWFEAVFVMFNEGVGGNNVCFRLSLTRRPFETLPSSIQRASHSPDMDHDKTRYVSRIPCVNSIARRHFFLSLFSKEASTAPLDHPSTKRWQAIPPANIVHLAIGAVYVYSNILTPSRGTILGVDRILFLCLVLQPWRLM